MIWSEGKKKSILEEFWIRIRHRNVSGTGSARLWIEVSTLKDWLAAPAPCHTLYHHFSAQLSLEIRPHCKKSKYPNVILG